MKRLFKFFLGISILFLLAIGFIIVFLSRISTSISANSQIINSRIIYYIFGSLIIIITNFWYFLLYKVIFSKCKFSYQVNDVLQHLWSKRKNALKKLKEYRKPLLLSFVFFVLILTIGNSLSNYLINQMDLDKYQFSFPDLYGLFFVPFFEELIYRKTYFDYCKKENIKHANIVNILIFCLIHIRPSLSLILVAILFTYCYKKYNSLFLNTTIHFIYNLLGIILPIILDSI